MPWYEVPPLRQKEHPRFINAQNWKEGQKSGAGKTHKVLVVNHTLGMEVDMLVPDLLCKDVTVGFG